MRSPPIRLFAPAMAIGLAAWISLATSSYGDQAPVKALSGAKAIAAPQGGCPAIRIGFNFRVRYISHFPINGGQEVLIRVATLDPVEMSKEFTSPPKIPGVDIDSISFEANGSGPVLVVAFGTPVHYSVRQGSDTSGIYLRIAGPDASEACLASMDLRNSVAPTAKSPAKAPGTSEVAAQANKPASEAPAGVSEEDKIEKEMSDARAAIARKDYSRAAGLLTKLIGLPAHKYSAEAQELLGVVRERNGQMAHAKAEYEIYLEKYPDGEGAQRVRQRLAAIETLSLIHI